MTDNKTNIEKGDILVSKCGYNCTLVSFYKVVDLTPSGKSAKIIQLKNKFVEDDGYGQAGTVIPSNEKFNDKILTKRIDKSSGNTDILKINNYEYAYIWDNKPVYFNSYD